MAICDTCARARSKLTHSGWVECKLRDIPPREIMQAYEDFIHQNGKIELPFHLVAMVQTTAEHAWPFQFDPQIIVECAGYTDKK
ncbi:hypothetical protein A6M27_01480 [Acidithiobacillus thiooxidans]|jgi:hypothetical protein|uniref:Uncharacterized protein n=1 Tax=Acidithiobacillus thiooxidans TaxID=930 RepID=A0A1C2IL54_ACITH|nr:hypothetical protein [Acidithiobacillus thiooxidans]OCX76544.1 hypothetical protein A6O24_08655 [Acidithiobacillus thiooxidans]OCX76698.1 hypothetical protein A6P07_01875 [Acidithiobacillus thiooxidans]OCX81162.1 hypothetical protein A6O26_13445 [Acidithiobacillus thiooxidans]OCX89565.1 hypothetical protein A6M27_01480 [Acidithiobacillus thiooxidans]